MIDYAIIAWIYRHVLRGHRRVDSDPQSDPAVSLDEPAAIKAAIVTAGALVCFALGFPTGVVALTAAALMLPWPPALRAGETGLQSTKERPARYARVRMPAGLGRPKAAHWSLYILSRSIR